VVSKLSRDTAVTPAVHVERMLGKSLPASIEAERALLGSVLLDFIHLRRIAEEVLPQDFYVPQHRMIYEAMLKLYNDSMRIDLILLQDELQKSGSLDTIGGVEYLISLQEDFSVVGFVEQHIGLVKEKALLRDIIASATSIVLQCYSQNDLGLTTVLDEAERVLFDISNKRSRQNFVQLDLWLKKTFQSLVDVQSSVRGVTGVPSGYSRLDEMTGGFQPGDFVVLAARPSMGKTALAMCLARNAAAIGKPVGVISLEMSAEQLTLRLLAIAARVNLSAVRSGVMSSQDWLQLTNAAAQLAAYKLFIDDTPLQTILDVRTKARKLKAEADVQLLIIDYLQLLHSVRKHESRHQEVSEISRFLKALAKELGIPVIALSQLSRAVESRVDKRPMLSDLRDSGAIEQDADLILFLYRDIAYHPETADPSQAELIIGKQRNGPTGTIDLCYIREHTLFENK